MARPIEPTPILKEGVAKKFEEKIKHDLKIPTSLIATPKLESGRRSVKEYAIQRKK